MKITFVLPYAGLAGGIKVAAIYADRLCRRGHEVCVVSTPRRGVTRLHQLGELLTLRRPSPRSTEHGLSHFDGLDIDWRVVGHSGSVTNDDVPDADVVVATWWETAEWVAELSVAKGVKAYFIQHHEIHDGQPKERVAATWKLPLHKVTISKWLSDTNQRMYGLGPIPVIHNSVDMEQFHAPARERGDPPTVGLLYSKTYWKGLALSFRAIEIARKQVPDLRVVMFGAHEEVAELPLPKGANLIVRPAQDQIRDIYARCDWWLCGSLAEGFHLPPLEAMACRVPVVSTAVGGPMDIVRDGENGFLSPVGDPEALGANLTRALELSSGDWKVMSDHALGTATDYTWDDATDRFESELQRIVAAGPLDRAI